MSAEEDKILPTGCYDIENLQRKVVFSVKASKTLTRKDKQILWNVVSAPENGADPETVFMTLNEGDELKSGTPFSLTIMSGAIFQ